MSPYARRPRQVFAEERDAIRSRGGTVRMSDALRLGISRKTFYAMRDASVLEQLGRRLFRLRDLPPPGKPRSGDRGDAGPARGHLPRLCALLPRAQESVVRS